MGVFIIGLDVFIITDDDIKKQKEFDEKKIEYNMLSDKNDGASGYLRKPYIIPTNNGEDICDDDGLNTVDFFIVTKRALNHMLNWVYLDNDHFKQFLYATKELNLDTGMDASLTINALNQVKSALIKLCEVENDNYINEKSIELIDFLKYGIELQLAGKHPKVSLC